MSERIPILKIGTLPEAVTALLQRNFNIVELDEGSGAVPAGSPLRSVRAIATTGKAVIGHELLASLPNVTIISSLGAGTEGIDRKGAEALGIAVTTTSAALAADVADVAMGLVLSLARGFRGADSFVRAGNWSRGRFGLGTSLKGARLGIIGLGNIGGALAQRAQAFAMTTAYHARSPRHQSELHYFDRLAEMAEWATFLAVCCPGGPQTRHIVNTGILDLLGPRGYLVNVSRGSTVDEAALADALNAGRLGGAGLDVFEEEPHPHPALLASDRTVLLPHIGSATSETREAMAVAMIKALEDALMPS
jgi:lactate dehydrogenase-like 2-hydroxyacid dehydrogenase